MSGSHNEGQQDLPSARSRSPGIPTPLRRYGFIIMDGNGTLFGALSGNTREILHKFSVRHSLPETGSRD